MTPFPILAAPPVASVFYSFLVSDTVGKAIVILLVVISIGVWTLMIQKYFDLRQSAGADQRFFREFERQSHPMELYVHRDLERFKDSPMAYVYAEACRATQREITARAARQHRHLSEINFSAEHLTPLQIDAVRKAAECAAADQAVLLETHMTVLGSAYTIAPMMGLFGTVWGVMTAFEGMGQQGMANLSAVAPGIASAMLTTVVGLVVAIPTAFGSNYLASRIQFLCIQLENFPDKFASRLQQTFLAED
jgi:biopolymer transport protein TolQ